jgi:SRSO17 transposase
LPEYGGLGPPTLPRYREAAKPLTSFVDSDTRFESVTWRQGSKGMMTSRFTVLEVRPSGKEATRTAQEAAGGRSRWNGVLPMLTLLIEQPAAAEPTGYGTTNLPATTPTADLVRWAKMRWRIEHGYRELKHGLGLDHFEGRTWRGWHHHVTLVTAAQAFLTLRRVDPKSPDAGLTPYQVLDALQDLLRCWTGSCTTCGRPLTANSTRART